MAKAARKSTTSAPKPAPVAFLNPALAPDRYALIVSGDCMAPLHPAGSAVLIDKREPYEGGDVVAIYLKPEGVKPGQSNCIIKRMVSVPPWVKAFPFTDHPRSEVHAIATVEMINPARRLYYRCADIMAVHRCLGAVPADVKLTGPLAARVHASDVSKGGDLTRRSVVMNALASTAAVSAIPMSSSSFATNADPIFAAIEAHKAATTVTSVALSVHSDLEESLPKDRRKTTLDAWSQEIVSTDDPRWIEAERQVRHAFEAEEQRALEMLDIRPTSLAGVAALLQYSFDVVAAGGTWPGELVDDHETHKRFGHDFSHFLHRHLAATVREFASQAA